MYAKGRVMVSGPCHKLRLKCTVCHLNIALGSLLSCYFGLFRLCHIHLALHEVKLTVRRLLRHLYGRGIRPVWVTVTSLHIVVHIKLLCRNLFRLEGLIRVLEDSLLYVEIQ